jgi:hypothetical protein
MNLRDFYVWTEALGCGEILEPCLKSYVTHHNIPIHVYIYKEDLSKLPVHPLIIPRVLTDELETDGLKKSTIVKAYMAGHRGTATLWASLIKNRDEKYFVHLDADTVFLADVVSPILVQLRAGFGVVGTRRPYKKRANRKFDYGSVIHNFQSDSVNTHCFGFDRTQIDVDLEVLIGLIQGQAKNRFIQRAFPMIDFFDRVTFHLRRKSGIYYLDSPTQARSGNHDVKGKIESSMISFAAVGSGCSYYKNPQSFTSESYKNFALRSFALYSKYLLDHDIGIPTLDLPFLLDQLDRLDRSTWTLRE